ncbi:MAG: hypothetical protein ACKVX9_15160 [Blastocatellia bacterium]
MTQLKFHFCASALLVLLFCSVEARAQLRFDKPKSEPPLENPYTIAVPRETILETVRDILKTCSIPVNEELSKVNEGKVITRNVVFTRGVTTKSDLEHLATMPAGEVRNWQQGRYSLEITSLPLDGKRSQILVSVHIQGKIADAMNSNQWIDGQSTGLLEDQVMRGLASKILGIDLSVNKSNKRRILNCEY